jgi:hypothetical protein
MSKSKVRNTEANSALEKGARSITTPAQPRLGSATDKSRNDVLPGSPATDLSEKIKELIRLAQEQGHLTYGDISDALPENVTEPEQLDEVFGKLRSLDIVSKPANLTKTTQAGSMRLMIRCECISSRWDRWRC